MSNYLNKQFENSTNGFKSWCRTFKHLFERDIVKRGYYKNGDFYLELNKVRSMNLGGGYTDNNYYLGISLREYNPIDKDFGLVFSYGEHEKKYKEVLELFAPRIYKFCDENRLMKDYYREMGI
jgi:hypothetical protein